MAIIRLNTGDNITVQRNGLSIEKEGEVWYRLGFGTGRGKVREIVEIYRKAIFPPLPDGVRVPLKEERMVRSFESKYERKSCKQTNDIPVKIKYGTFS